MVTDFRKIFQKDPVSLWVDPGGRADAKEMHAKRSELRKLAKGLLDVVEKENRQMTESEKDAFDTATALIEDIRSAFDAKDERIQAAEAFGGVGATSSRCLETWQDAKSGQAIPVLAKEHRFADHVRGESRVSAGDYFSAISGGDVAPEARDAMNTSVGSEGGYMVPEHVSAEVIDLLRAKSVCVAAGARTFPMVAPDVRVCRIDEDPTASWVPENNLIPDASMAIGATWFRAKKLTCLIKISRELLQDASGAQNVILQTMATAMAGELDSACLTGDGIGKPLGVYNHTGICSYEIGGNGAALSGYSDLLQGINQIATANAPLPNVAVMSPRTLVGYSLITDGEGQPMIKPDLVKNLTFLDSTKMPVNEVQGNSSTCSSIILGGFSNLVIGIRSTLEVQVLRERYAEFGQVGFLCTMRADSALYQPSAFCKISGILPN